MFTSVSWARSVSVSIFDSDEADRSSPGPSKAVSPFVPHSATALHTFTAPEPPPPELPQLIQLRIMGLCGGGRHFPEGMDIPFSWAIERHPLGEEGMS